MSRIVKIGMAAVVAFAVIAGAGGTPPQTPDPVYEPGVAVIESPQIDSTDSDAPLGGAPSEPLKME